MAIIEFNTKPLSLTKVSNDTWFLLCDNNPYSTTAATQVSKEYGLSFNNPENYKFLNETVQLYYDKIQQKCFGLTIRTCALRVLGIIFSVCENCKYS